MHGNLEIVFCVAGQVELNMKNIQQPQQKLKKKVMQDRYNIFTS